MDADLMRERKKEGARTLGNIYIKVFEEENQHLRLVLFKN